MPGRVPCLTPESVGPTAIPTEQWTVEWLSNYSEMGHALQAKEDARNREWLIRNKVSLMGAPRGESSANYGVYPSFGDRLRGADDVFVGIVEEQTLDQAVMPPFDFELPFLVSRLRLNDGSTVDVAQGGGASCYAGYLQLVSRDTLLLPGVPYVVAVDRDASVHGVPQVVRGFSYFAYDDRLVPAGGSFIDDTLLGAPPDALRRMVGRPEDAAGRLEQVADNAFRARLDAEYQSVSRKIVADFAEHGTSAELLSHGWGRTDLSDPMSLDQAVEIAEAVISGEIVGQAVQYCDASHSQFCLFSRVQQAEGISTIRHRIAIVHDDGGPGITETTACHLPDVGQHVAVLVTDNANGTATAIPFHSYVPGGRRNGFFPCRGESLGPDGVSVDELTSRLRSAHAQGR